MHLKGRGNREKERGLNCWFTRQMLQKPGVGQAKGGIPELHVSLPPGVAGSEAPDPSPVVSPAG